MKLLIGGSPCTHWSIAQTKHRETEPSGLGWELFLNYLIAREKYRPDYFLYENNKSMSPAIRAQITRELGVEPILINSALVSAQSRQRLYWTNIIRCIETNGHFSADGVAEPVNITADGKAQCLRATYYKDGIRNLVGNTIDRKTCVAVRVGDMPNGEGEIIGSQSKRIYSVDGKSVPLQARPNGGGADGAATGLYAVPTGIAWRGRDGSSSYEVRSDQKTNAVTADGHQSRMVIIAAGGKAHPVYSVTDGFIEIKGKKYPIRLPDGLYIIRKLTVNECKRLQTVPEWYHFSVSQTQAYKMLGNGWTVDVISHILSYCPGLTETPTEVFSMYDGMSCGRLALLKLGVNITNYYATEIDKYAIATTQENFPDTIQLGDAFWVREDDWTLQKGGVINE